MDENTTPPPAVPAPPFSAPGPPEEPTARKRPAKKTTARKATAPAGPPAKRPARKTPPTGSIPVVPEPPATEPPATGSVPAAKKAAKSPATGSVPVAKKAAAKKSPPTGPVPVAKKAAKAPVKKAAGKKAAPAAPPTPPTPPAPPTPATPVEPPAATPAAAFELPLPEPAPAPPALEPEPAPEPPPAPEPEAAPAPPPAPEPEPAPEPPLELPVAAETAEDIAAAPAAATPASAEDVEKARSDNRLAQVLYHDWESQTYDDKWSISFDDRCISYARDRFAALLGPEILRTEAWPYGKALEIGAGTGFFALNLKQAGVLGDVTVSDVSAGMVEAAQDNARKLGFEVQGAVAGAESLPFDDGTFDVVVGHAVIHHIPDVEAALREVLRVLKPGGRFVIAGEPTRIGDWYARRLGRVTWKATTRITRLPRLRDRWAKSQEELDASSRAASLESVVDLHTFVPSELAATAERAGAVEVHTQTEEFLAALLGWPVRTFESAVHPDRLGWGWAMFAYRSWLRLSAVDRALGRVLPDGVFYNVGVTGVKPVR